MQARNFTTNVPKILDLKSSSEQIFFRKLSLGAPAYFSQCHLTYPHAQTVLYDHIKNAKPSVALFD